VTKKISDLTRRERDVLVALCKPVLRSDAFTEPASIREVAETLGISDAAVKQHFLRLYDKFELYDGEERRRLKLANLVLTAGVVSRADLGEAAAEPAPAKAAETAATGAEPSDALAAGREAARFRNWERAYERLSVADQAQSPLGAADLETLGEAAVWSGRNEESIAARQRAYAIHEREGNSRRAAAVALGLVVNNVVRLNFSLASGWLAKAKRHLEGQPPCAELGYYVMTEALFALAQGNSEVGLERARVAFASGTRHGDNDLRALGLVFQGYALAQLGRLPEAVPMLDEAMASAIAGELGPLATGIVYCRTVCACLEAFDYRRAFDWTEAIAHVAGDSCTAGYPGDCRAHQASILVFRGEWAKGEDEARAASRESERFDLAHSGLALYEIGQIRLRSGDLDGAAGAFKQALELGMNPQPGLALLQLARGDVEAATISIHGAIEETAPESLRRARLLPTQVDIASASGDPAAARLAAEELARIADKWPITALRSAAEGALGVTTLMEGDHAAAVRRLRQAYRLWREVDAPYEAARTRVHLARALGSLGDTASARLELEAALTSFDRLGARLDAERATAALAAASGA
jgi:tetratricopeptide (TPR) repeat protein